MQQNLRYEALVSARTRDEAIEIAAEAVPRGKRLAQSEARDVSAEEGPDSWLVILYFADE